MQDQLRSGTQKVDRASLEIPNEEEIQQTTINRNYALGVDYSPHLDCGVNLQLPYYDRYHTTIAEGDTRPKRRRAARRQATHWQHRQRLHRWAAAGRAPRPRTATGTRTTDLLVGAFTFGALNRDWDYFAQAMLQQPMNSRDGFRPGTGPKFNAGLRYMAIEGATPSLQVNARIEGREAGANADVANSGASLVYLSPGLNLQISERLHGYAYLQLPIHQRVNGLQIEPRYTATIGQYYTM